MNLQQHPLSAIFPSLPDDELNALAADIKAHGLHSAITLYKGEVLDGWHRYRACEIAGVNPRTMEYRGSDPVAFVKSANWHRRHLSSSQRAFAETNLVHWKPAGNPSLTPQNCGVGKSTAEMAEESGTSERTIQQAKTVRTNGADTLKEAVKEGKIAVSKAAKIAKLPKEKQAKAMAEPKKKKARPAKPVDEWKAKHDKLAEDYADLKENRDDLAGELKTCEAVRTGTLALEMKQLREHLKICTRRRDELMANAVEMRKSLAYWKKQAEKLGWKPK